MTRGDDRRHELSRRKLFAPPAVAATASVLPSLPEPSATASTVAPSGAVPEPLKGRDGLTDWQRARLASEVESFRTRLKPVKPMASIRNMSPAFRRMAIDLDVRLCEYRDTVGRVTLIRWGMCRHDIPQVLIAADGRTIPNPDIQALFEIEKQAEDRLHHVLDKIRRTTAITGGDRTLKSRSDLLKLCPFYRQLDFLELEKVDRLDATMARSGRTRQSA